MRRRLTPRRILAGSATLAIAMWGSAAILPAASATMQPVGTTGNGTKTTDTRDVTSALEPTRAQLDAARALVADAPKGARITWDERFGTPRTAFGTGGYLTDARTGSAVDVARAWIADNREAFGMSAAQVDSLRVDRNHALPGTGTRVITLTQLFDGVAAVQGGRLNVAVTQDGKVLSYGGNPPGAAGSPARSR